MNQKQTPRKGEEKKPKTLKDVLNGISTPLVVLWGYAGVHVQNVGGIRAAKKIHISKINSYERWKFFQTKLELYNWWERLSDVDLKYKVLQSFETMRLEQESKLILLP
jgi:hypothetical protein